MTGDGVLGAAVAGGSGSCGWGLAALLPSRLTHGLGGAAGAGDGRAPGVSRAALAGGSTLLVAAVAGGSTLLVASLLSSLALLALRGGVT